MNLFYQIVTIVQTYDDISLSERDFGSFHFNRSFYLPSMKTHIEQTVEVFEVAKIWKYQKVINWLIQLWYLKEKHKKKKKKPTKKLNATEWVN